MTENFRTYKLESEFIGGPANDNDESVNGEKVHAAVYTANVEHIGDDICFTSSVQAMYYDDAERVWKNTEEPQDDLEKMMKKEIRAGIAEII
jgi:hypothetical protein